MKKLIVVAIVVIAILLLPLIPSKMARSYFESQAEKVQDLPGYTFEIVDYQEGYLSSNAKLKLGFDMDSMFNPDASAAELAVLEALNDGITLSLRIDHGPLVMKPEVFFGMAHYTMTLGEDIPELKEVQDTLGVDHLFKVEGNISFTGNDEGNVSIPSFSFNENGNSISFGGLSVDVDSKSYGKSYSFNGQLGETVVNSPMLNVNVAAAPITGAGSVSENPMLSPGTFAMNFPMITFTGMDSGSVENFRIAGESTVSDNNTINFYISYSVDKVQSAMAGLNLSDAIIHLGFENIDGDAFMELLEKSQEFSTSEPDPEVMMEIGKKFIKGSPTFVIKNVGYSLNDVPNLAVSGHLKINSDVLGDNPDFENPMLLISAVDCELDATVHENLVEQGLQLYAVRQTQDLSQQMEITPEQMGQMIEQTGQQMNMMLEQFIQQGYITRDGTNYIIDAAFKQGGLSLNGKPLNMM